VTNIITKRFAVFLTWKDLFDQIPTEDEVLAVIRTFNRQSTIVLLSRIGVHLFVDQFRQNASETISLQGFLISNFLDLDILNRWKNKMPNAHFDFHRAFHPQQILTMIKLAVLYALPVGGLEPDKNSDARFALGRCLLKTNDLLMSQQMATDIARDRKQAPSVKRYLRLQLAIGAGVEVFNPPPVPNGVVRSKIIFEEIIKQIPLPVNLNSQLELQAGISLDSYVDLTFGVLAAYMGKTQNEFIADAGLAILNPATFFGSSVPTETTERFWKMESSTIDEFAKILTAPSELISNKDFTAFRMSPFFKLDSGAVICPNPGFIQEKLEIGLFWTIVNNLEGENRQKAFETWGKLFEKYVNQTFEEMVAPATEKYFTCPDFKGKKHHHEAFDGILLAGRVCAVVECKGGFLPNNAKYADNLDHFIDSLDKKFGTGPGAGVEQLVRKIAQIFAANPAQRRELEAVDLSSVEIIVPVLVVQDSFVSSMFTVPWFAKSFRDLMRKQTLNRRVVLTSLLVLHVEDVEAIQRYIKTGDFSVAECLLYAGKCGDPGSSSRQIFEFADLFREFLKEKNIQSANVAAFDNRFDEILNRMTLRFFNQPFEPFPSDHADPSKEHKVS
jgi:hypothetical protein